MDPRRDADPARLARARDEVLVENRALIRGVERRAFLGRGLSLGALAMLTGCSVGDVTYVPAVHRFLRRVSSWNDRVQAALFDPTRLAPTYTDAEVARPPRFNAFYPIDRAPRIKPADYTLELSGRIENKRPLRLDDLRRMPQETQITRHICIEGWSYVGKWTGVPLRTFFERVGADTTAKYVRFVCADTYFGSLDMATALHPQTQLALKYDDAELEAPFGFPMRVRVATKLGFKSPKHVVAIEVTNRLPKPGFWERTGYNWFSGI